MPRTLSLVLVAAFSWCPATAQVEWRRLPINQLSPMGDHAAAWHGGTSRVVLTGGVFTTETWTWDGTRWQLAQPSQNPPVFTGHAMAGDTGRDRVVLFGGSAGTTTWEWDGADWSARNLPGPSARRDHAMAFHEGRDEVLLFGGALVFPPFPLGDTWSFDGTSWQQFTGANPPARRDHGMAYDGARDQVVLFGGADQTGTRLSDTWVWNGTWTQAATGGPVLDDVAMAYDRDRSVVVMHGTTQGRSSTWLWDGTTWQLSLPIIDPGSRNRTVMAWDGITRQTLLTGGMVSLVTYQRDTWSFDGADWVLRDSAEVPPVDPGMCFATAYLSGEALLVTTGGQSFAHSGFAWREVSPGALPNRRNPMMAGTPTAMGVVLYGGRENLTPLDDTWLWSGGAWTQGPQGPSPRDDAAMAFDAINNRVVMFGGRQPAGPDLAQHWEFDGTAWSERTGITLPSGRWRHAMAWDLARDRIVLFGGERGGTALGDTWEWDGASWTRVATTGPTSRLGAELTFDATRNVSVLVGGYVGATALIDVWEWDGTTWTERLPGSGPDPAHRKAAAFHPLRESVLVFAGPTVSSPTQDATWDYGPVNPATFRAVGASCGAAWLQGDTSTRPWVGETLRLRVGGITAGTRGFVGIGWERQTWSGLTLPAPLDPFGYPGCSLLVGPEILLPYVAPSTVALVSLGIPASPALIGQEFAAQGALRSPREVTNAVEFRIGSR